MNRYPVWKYVVILIALVVGGLYALPNFFGEAPAVQVSSVKTLVKVDGGTLAQVEAALKSAAIEPDQVVLEAASIDGANGWKRMRYVTLPLMTPSFVITFFLTLRNCFMVYDINYGLTGGGPYQSTQMISMYIVQKAFQESKFAVGQAEAVILFIIVAVISVIQVNLGKRREVDA